MDISKEVVCLAVGRLAIWAEKNLGFEMKKKSEGYAFDVFGGFSNSGILVSMPVRQTNSKAMDFFSRSVDLRFNILREEDHLVVCYVGVHFNLGANGNEKWPINFEFQIKKDEISAVLGKYGVTTLKMVQTREAF